jgi:hypothetical protein
MKRRPFGVLAVPLVHRNREGSDGRDDRPADSGALRVPAGQPIFLEKFSDAVYLAEAPEHGGKPLLVFEP